MSLRARRLVALLLACLVMLPAGVFAAEAPQEASVPEATSAVAAPGPEASEPVASEPAAAAEPEAPAEPTPLPETAVEAEVLPPEAVQAPAAAPPEAEAPEEAALPQAGAVEEAALPQGEGSLLEYIYAASDDGAALPMQPDSFSPAQSDYRVMVPDAAAGVSLRARPATAGMDSLTLVAVGEGGSETPLVYREDLGEYAAPTGTALKPGGPGASFALELRSDGVAIERYTLHLLRRRSLESLTVQTDTSGPLSFTPGFAGDVTTYTALVPGTVQKLTFTPALPGAVGLTEKARYRVRVYEEGAASTGYTEIAPGASAAVTLPNSGLNTLRVEVLRLEEETLEGEAHPGRTTYTFLVDRGDAVPLHIGTTPADARVMLENAEGYTLTPESTGAYAVVDGGAYTCTVTAAGYKSATLPLTVQAVGGAASLTVPPLSPAQPAPGINPALPAEWPSFRGGESNNGLTAAPTPAASGEAALYWASFFGKAGSGKSPSPPILVNGRLVVLSGAEICLLDTLTGEVLLRKPLRAPSDHSITPPTYAEGMIFVSLAGGIVQALDAQTLDTLWVYQDPLGGQANTPIVYKNGYLYTGFWTGDTSPANMVCLAACDETPGDNEGEKRASWRLTRSGGFYWAGAYAAESFVLVGTAQGTLLSLDPCSGRVISETGGFGGEVRCSIMAGGLPGRYYFTSKGGTFYEVQVSEAGIIGSRREFSLGAGSVATPVIAGTRAYVGADNATLYVLELGDGAGPITAAYTLPTGSNVRTSGLLSTGAADGVACVYFMEYATPGTIRVIKDRPGATAPLELASDGRAPVLFTPKREQAQFGLCSLIAGADGTLYFKNDSGYMMALGSTVTGLSIAQPPTKTSYLPGEAFCADGLRVEARYANGRAREVTEYLTIDEATPLTAEDIDVALRFEHLLYNDGGALPAATVYQPVTVGRPVTGVSLSHAALSLAVGESARLSATVQPQDAASKAVSWASGNEAVAGVSATGLVMARGAGAATITATTRSGGFTARCRVTVAQPPPPAASTAAEAPPAAPEAQAQALSRLAYPQKRITLAQGRALTLVPLAENEAGTVKTSLIYTTNKPKVATVSAAGKITAKGSGSAKITATAENGMRATLTVKVVSRAIPLDALTATGAPKTLRVGKSKSLGARLSPAGATGVKLSWKSSNPRVIRVDATGRITALKKGEAKITLTGGGKKAVTRTIRVTA